jgi:hypothetical protein
MRYAIAAALTLVASLFALAEEPKKKEPAKDEPEYTLVPVSGMSLYCLTRGKILALVAVDKDGTPLAGVCAYPPGVEEEGESKDDGPAQAPNGSRRSS